MMVDLSSFCLSFDKSHPRHLSGSDFNPGGRKVYKTLNASVFPYHLDFYLRPLLVLPDVTSLPRVSDQGVGV